MQCGHFEAGRCRSCALMGTPYDAQLAEKQRQVAATLPTGLAWLPPVASRESGFRNKAKLVAAGTRGAPVLGILDRDQHGIDLTNCGLYEPGLAEAVRTMPRLVAELGLTPYDVPRRTGELKHVLLTHSPDDELMLRFVLRSPGQLRRIRDGLALLREELSGLRVVSANLQPEHKAIIEGDEEHVLTPEDSLPMRVNDVTLHLRTRSFFQTNTAVAAALYAQARAWIADLRPSEVWDLYCGVGGFALHALGHGADRVVGVESSAEAVASARLSGAALARGHHEWHAGDATRMLDDPVLTGRSGPDLVVVNPPRRGIGAALCARLDEHGPRHVLYSSCNVTTLAADLAAMPRLRPIAARLFDMFPQTGHHEVMVLLERDPPAQA
ncbi:methyltransferase domain-containing protein [Nocardioides sp. AE5]|uniref:methyltransferase domain-containing protein n=1 Tax=Nocardioides sp. AE5 TaxID=2962573 RepID=UPI00288292C7|nr:methyltransferase domain-containing protein [Nocardioides sp. AE5]MDT0203520.1 methyltransferase domain-containing protein [Nocardioides sp. AE5]